MSADIASISPVPTEEEAVAIAAAITLMWPQPSTASSEKKSLPQESWRFSGRWWANNAISRRGRPGS